LSISRRLFLNVDVDSLDANALPSRSAAGVLGAFWSYQCIVGAWRGPCRSRHAPPLGHRNRAECVEEMRVVRPMFAPREPNLTFRRWGRRRAARDRELRRPEVAVHGRALRCGCGTRDARRRATRICRRRSSESPGGPDSSRSRSPRHLESDLGQAGPARHAEWVRVRMHPYPTERMHGHLMGRRRDQPEGSSREVKPLRLLARGALGEEHRHAPGDYRETARNHIEHIYAKTGASNRVRASLFAVQHGLIPADAAFAER
jgi:hypothetical protein